MIERRRGRKKGKKMKIEYDIFNIFINFLNFLYLEIQSITIFIQSFNWKEKCQKKKSCDLKKYKNFIFIVNFLILC